MPAHGVRRSVIECGMLAVLAVVTLAELVSAPGIEDLLGQMMGGQGGFQQMGGGQRRQRQVVEEPEYELDVDDEFEWLAGVPHADDLRELSGMIDKVVIRQEISNGGAGL